MKVTKASILLSIPLIIGIAAAGPTLTINDKPVITHQTALAATSIILA